MKNKVETNYEEQRGGRLWETTWRQPMRNKVEADYEKQGGGRQ